jgi:hypothetical protein
MDTIEYKGEIWELVSEAEYAGALSVVLKSLPKERFWFHPSSGSVFPVAGFGDNKDWLEVTPEYAEYLHNKPEGEWELRIPNIGDVVTPRIPFAEKTATVDYTDAGVIDRGYRWCKPKQPKAGWRVYDVVEMHGMYYVDFKDEYKRLYECQDIVGFGGVQFEGQRVDCWSMSTCACIDKDGYMPTFAEDDEVPAVPIRARFWEAYES